jgi:glutathione peroxidase-family protein
MAMLSNDYISEAQETILPFSIYDIKLASADKKQNDILSSRKGKVTLLFNVAAGCGNIPQHSVLEELNQKYKNVDDFNILAVVVDDFTCHGYPEFQNGLKAYIEEHDLHMEPGELAKQYAEQNFGTTYEFSELTNGRFDKHTYDNTFVPGKVKLQEQHPLWWYLTGGHEADLQENGVPYHAEEIPWSDEPPVDTTGKKVVIPLSGNFQKFLINKDGTRIKRYANGFLLGERNVFGETFPWVAEKYKDDGRRDHEPKTTPTEDQIGKMEQSSAPWPNAWQRKGIDISLEIISKDIDAYLAE